MVTRNVKAIEPAWPRFSRAVMTATGYHDLAFHLGQQGFYCPRWLQALLEDTAWYSAWAAGYRLQKNPVVSVDTCVIKHRPQVITLDRSDWKQLS